MIEVFEIGVSLALADGVLDGVAAAKRDMRAVEVAMAAGAVSVQRLREAASAALELPQAKPVKSAGPGQRETPFAAGQDAPDRSLPAIVRGLDPVAVAPSALVATPIAGAARALPELAAASGEADRSSLPGRNAALPMPRAPAAASAPQATPVVTILRMESGPPGGAPAVAGTDVGLVRPDANSFVQPARQPSRPVFDAPVSVLPPPAAASDSASGRHVEKNFAGGSFAEAAAAPAGPASFAGAPADGAEQGGAEPRSAPSAPAGGGREQARMEGDVFLDGTLVGRWMSGYLAREAGRASAGPTGFDGRRDPLLPGATVGM